MPGSCRGYAGWIWTLDLVSETCLERRRGDACCLADLGDPEDRVPGAFGKWAVYCSGLEKGGITCVQTEV
jgi:hypothetical protein